MTLAVQSGILTQIRVTPISSALVRGSETLAMVRLLDRLGNQTTPDLHSLRLDVTGGYIRGADGEKRMSMTMDVMESQVPIVIGADTAGTLHITATIDGTVVSNQDITIYDSAQIVLKRDRDPRV